MTNAENGLPPGEKLAAFVDGELEPDDRLAVERWLVDHPEARTDVAGQRRLARAWEATRPAEPDENVWLAALAGIQDRIQTERQFLPRRRLPLWWLAGLAAAIVAGIALFLANREPQPESATPDVPFQMASADDVEITSFADADSDDVLLVGFAPVREPMLLADHGEIELDEMTPEPGMNPRFDQQQGMPPMIVPDAEVKQP
jgi:anti-sigma-K factor RskA